MFRFIPIAIALLLFAAPSHAGPLGPKKASQIVQLICSGATCVTLSPSWSRAENDSSVTPNYEIPAGQVLVVTSLTANSFGGTPGASAGFYWGIRGPNLVQTGYLNTTFDSAGIASVKKEFPTGFVIKSGSLPLLVCPGTNAQSYVTGYLAPDK